MGLSLLAIAIVRGRRVVTDRGHDAAGAAAKRLTAAEQALVTRSERAVQRYCGELALSLTGQRKPPSVAEQGRAFAATDRLIELARKKPAATPESRGEMRLFLGDLAEDLEGSNCDPAAGRSGSTRRWRRCPGPNARGAVSGKRSRTTH